MALIHRLPDMKTQPAAFLGWSLLVIVVGATFPVLSMLAASAIARSHGCKLDEGNAHPCVVLGVDLGKLLYSMAVMVWLALMTVPIGAIALAAWAVTAIVLLLRHLRGGRPA